MFVVLLYFFFPDTVFEINVLNMPPTIGSCWFALSKPCPVTRLRALNTIGVLAFISFVSVFFELSLLCRLHNSGVVIPFFLQRRKRVAILVDAPVTFA